jgi:large subunit ribosomal protein L5e
MITSRFKKQFSSYLESGIGSDDIEEVYKNAHAAIREDPSFKPRDKTKDWKAETLKHKTHRLTLAQRKQAIQDRIEKFKAGADAAMEEDGDE